MTTTLERPTSRGTGTALLIAGPVVAVAAFLAALAGLNWYDSGHPLSSNLLTQTVALLLLVVLPVLLGGALVWRGSRRWVSGGAHGGSSSRWSWCSAARRSSPSCCGSPV